MVERPEVREVTALGAAYLAGLAVGCLAGWTAAGKAVVAEFRPGIETTERLYRYAAAGRSG